MRALKRGCEIINEPFGEWVEANMTFLTKCDGWILIENYAEPLQESDPVEIIEEPSQPAEETVTINGKTYTKSELRNILNS